MVGYGGHYRRARHGVLEHCHDASADGSATRITGSQDDDAGNPGAAASQSAAATPTAPSRDADGAGRQRLGRGTDSGAR